MNHLEHMELLIKAIQHEPILLNEGIPTNKEDMLDEFNIKITRSGVTLHIDMGPKSSEFHDCKHINRQDRPL